MISMYSRRLLSPYVGVVQVAEFEQARAVSLDGKNWAIQYAFTEEARQRIRQPAADPSLRYSLVATVKQGNLRAHTPHPSLDPNDVKSTIQALFQAVSAARVPFPAADRFEYWLLDADQQRPLALLQSCTDEQEIPLVTLPPGWIAMPAAQLDVPAPESDQESYVPPVNYRLEKLVEERAGMKPRAAWFERTDPAADDFPPCLIREDWQDKAQQQLCERYIQRLAPRLLMMKGLPMAVRQRLEHAARNHVFEVERFYPLYPEVADSSLLTAARVEAEIRRAADA